MVDFEQYQMLIHISNSESPTFNYLIQNCPLGMSWDWDEASGILGKLENIKLIEQDNNEVFSLTENGKKLLSAYLESQKGEHENISLEQEKLRLEVEELRNKFFDYDTVKFQAKWGLILAGIATAAAIVSIFT